MEMERCVHRGIFRTKLSIYNGTFFTSVKPYFENILNLIELPLGCSFFTTHPFAKKLTTLKTLGEKVYFNSREIFFSKFEIMQ